LKLRPPRKLPPRAEGDRWYSQPVTIPPRKDGTQRIQAQQGDIFLQIPSVVIRSRPLAVIRPLNGSPTKYVANWINEAGQGTELRRFLPEDLAQGDPQPTPAFAWDTAGEDVVQRVTRSMAVLMSQDCELDKPHKKVLLSFARIRVTDGSQSVDAITNMKNRNEYRSFYLAPQGDKPTLPECYVDFGAITTLSLQSIVETDGFNVRWRYLSMHPDVRDAMRQDFVDFMVADREPEDE
jgi:hypothetical protein